MKKTLRLCIFLMASTSTLAMADTINAPISIYTANNWSNIRVVNFNNPGVICYQSGLAPAGTSIFLSQSDLSSDKFKNCYDGKGFGFIFNGVNTGKPYLAKKTTPPGQRCVASYKILSGLTFDCSKM